MPINGCRRIGISDACRSRSVVDEWMYDAALETRRWWLAGRRFQPALGARLPTAIAEGGEVVSRKRYRRAVTRHSIRSSTNKYLDSVEAEWGVPKADYGQSKRDAEWYHSGVPIREICDELPAYRGDEQTARSPLGTWELKSGC